ncbi:FAD-dependent oxidoreductase [Fulvivirgaceae bacterium BMA12]|uniref:FAD-dependent oxidoreductase n=1 Tax=Agaribacillus aureus TaxID=3051825 RepID=A0ABT8L031_9BACT|nr:FAD-dependent oxidoreductase [Fulvivirgaceae bacterium BMA12]
MKKPIILAIDDDPSVLRAVVRDLRSNYKQDYRIMSTTSAVEALTTLKELFNRGETIALFISDQRMPEMLGVEFLESAKKFYPKAKRILLTAYSDTKAAIKAINDVQLDYYLLKPWNPPEENLYPVINDQLDEWQNHYKPRFEGIKIIGYQWCSKSHNIKDFLSGNLIPYLWMDIETSTQALELMDLNSIEQSDLPVVLLEDGQLLKNPSLGRLGEKVGMNAKAHQTMYDVAIIGAGPAGLAAAVYGGSEGLNTILIEKRAPGGQAGTSSRIENYLGFPKGLSGAELSRRAISQAARFGIEFLSPQEVVNIRNLQNHKIIYLENGDEINARSIVISTGVDYRKLPAKGIGNFTGAGVYYGAATTEAKACENKDVYIVGGGNSAGQAAMYLSNFAKTVNILIRKDNLTSSMSHYLIGQINNTKNIHVFGKTEVTQVSGNGKLEQLTIKNNRTGKEQSRLAAALLIFIGARPYTDWIKLDIIKDERGFIETGNSLNTYDDFKKMWKLDRKPYLLETCCPGIFAAGDVRAGAMNRVASAVGEGSMAIKFVHEYLAEN